MSEPYYDPTDREDDQMTKEDFEDITEAYEKLKDNKYFKMVGIGNDKIFQLTEKDEKTRQGKRYD